MVVYETEVKKSYVAGLLKNAVTTLNPMTLQCTEKESQGTGDETKYLTGG